MRRGSGGREGWRKRRGRKRRKKGEKGNYDRIRQRSIEALPKFVHPAGFFSAAPKKEQMNYWGYVNSLCVKCISRLRLVPKEIKKA